MTSESAFFLSLEAFYFISLLRPELCVAIESFVDENGYGKMPQQYLRNHFSQESMSKSFLYVENISITRGMLLLSIFTALIQLVVVARLTFFGSFCRFIGRGGRRVPTPRTCVFCARYNADVLSDAGVESCGLYSTVSLFVLIL